MILAPFLVTEANCAGYDPGKQFLSLINGLLVPEYFAQACGSGADAFLWWDLHNHPETNFNISTTLHGWREYGDFGILAGSVYGLGIVTLIGGILIVVVRGAQES